MTPVYTRFYNIVVAIFVSSIPWAAESAWLHPFRLHPFRLHPFRLSEKKLSIGEDVHTLGVTKHEVSYSLNSLII